MKIFKIFFLFFLPLLTLNCNGCGGNDNDFDIDPDVTAGDGTGGTGVTGGAGDTGSSGGSTSGSSTGSDTGATGSESGGTTSAGETTSGSGSGFDFDLIDWPFPGHSSGGGSGSESGGSDTSGSSGGTGIEPGNFPVGTLENLFDRKIDWHLAALWRGLEMEFTDGSCQNHKIKKVGQSVSYYPTQEDDHNYKLDMTFSSTLQSKEKESKSHDYRYKTHYTSIAFDSKYMKALQGSLSLDSDHLNDGEKTITLDIVDYMLDGFKHPNSVNVDILLQGFEVSFENTIKPSTLSVALDVEWDENNQLVVTATPKANSSETYSMTIHYLVVFSDPEYVWVANDLFSLDTNLNSHSGLTLDDCSSDSCSYTFEVDPLVTEGEKDLTYFTALTAFGFSNASVGEVRKIRGYSRFTNEEDLPQTTLKGEVLHEKCGTTDQSVAPMNTLKTLTFVCKDKYICRANQMDLSNWNTVDVGDSDETTTSKNFEEGWYFETPPED